jgi:hypothetical protein
MRSNLAFSSFSFTVFFQTIHFSHGLEHMDEKKYDTNKINGHNEKQTTIEET